MAKRLPCESYALRILNALMNTDKALTTNQLCEIAGCERKTVYSAIARLEISGFGVEVVHVKKNQNAYKFVGVFGNWGG